MYIFVWQLQTAGCARHPLDCFRNGRGLILGGGGGGGSAVDEDGRYVEPAHRHHHAGQRLVAAGDADQSVIAVAPHGEFHRISDHFAGWQRRPHAVVPHGNAVGDRDGAELAWRSARRRDALLDGLSLTHQRDVTRRRLVPAASNPDERLVDLLVGKPHSVV